MKRIRVPLIVLFFICLANPGEGSPAFPGTFSLDPVFSGLKTPQSVAHFLKGNFGFVEDAKLFGTLDHWQSPEEFWQRKQGDCEDYALFAAEALRRQGLEVYVISFYGTEGYAHTIAVFRRGGTFNVIDEDRLDEFRAKTLEEALTRVHPGWTWAAFAERRGPRGWPLARFQNPRHLVL